LPRLDLSVLNVIDVESTCWEGKPPPGQEQEIIEIGICALDLELLAPLEAESVLVRPQRSTVSPFCTHLTTLTQAEVDSGIPFADACALLLRRYSARERVWASYGDFDRLQFERQCLSFGVEYPFGRRHLNVNTWLALSLGLPHEPGMAEALRLLSMPLHGTHHRGGDDAQNIARIVERLLSDCLLHKMG
jgi:inhibitor of KinA sporulation pathway (predicted exonuclease)